MKRRPGDTTARAAGIPRWGRRVAHLLAIFVGWALFFWGWQRVPARADDFSELRLLMLGAAIVVPVVTVSWILHNRGIHRRKGPRRSVPAAALDYRVDFVGRTVIADFHALMHAQCVDIVVEAALKQYLPHQAVAKGWAALAAPTHSAEPPARVASTPRNAEATRALNQALTQAASPAAVLAAPQAAAQAAAQAASPAAAQASAHAATPALTSAEAVNGTDTGGDNGNRAAS